MKRLLITIALLGAAAGILVSHSTGNPKVDRLLSQMTLAEKIAMIHGASEDPSTSQGQPGYVPASRDWEFRHSGSSMALQGC